MESDCVRPTVCVCVCVCVGGGGGGGSGMPYVMRTKYPHKDGKIQNLYPRTCGDIFGAHEQNSLEIILSVDL